MTSTTRLKDCVIERLQDLVASGRYPPGSKLPSERELRDEFGVGRSTVREGLRALEAVGLIELQQGRGAFVRDRVDDADPAKAPFADWPSSYEWSIEDIVEARLTVETRAAGLAALRRTDDDLAEMLRQLDAFQAASEASDLSALVLADIAFHDAIAKCGNQIFVSLLKSLRALGVRSRRTSLAQPERWPTVMRRHKSIYEAIVLGEPHTAAQRMERHLLDFARELGVDVPMYRQWMDKQV
ncbi:MAG: GntR family transcriptional regulator, transcriptional repressor for pyruvate dehydrogenase complex [Thermomicrobiales bacterium]|nr:GntR family transcriptional regulator, transcriptional repressor for pyruvate dehydrogenase complex [Thermomicrobiales bacterium]